SRLYQVMRMNKSEGRIEVSPLTPGVLASALATEMPEVEHAAHIAYPQSMNTLSTGEEAIKSNGIYAGKDLFELFSFELIKGNKRALSDDSNIVLSKQLALKLFGTVDAIIGKFVTFDNAHQFIISGIVEIDPKSSIQFDFILPFSLFEKHYSLMVPDWGRHSPETYVVLKQGADITRFNEKLGQILKEKANDEQKTIIAGQFSSGYLYDSYENGIQNGGKIDYVKLFSIIGIYILIIACINYVNLSTAVSSMRA